MLPFSFQQSSPKFFGPDSGESKKGCISGEGCEDPILKGGARAFRSIWHIVYRKRAGGGRATVLIGRRDRAGRLAWANQQARQPLPCAWLAEGCTKRESGSDPVGHGAGRGGPQPCFVNNNDFCSLISTLLTRLPRQTDLMTRLAVSASGLPRRFMTEQSMGRSASRCPFVGAIVDALLQRVGESPSRTGPVRNCLTGSEVLPALPRCRTEPRSSLPARELPAYRHHCRVEVVADAARSVRAWAVRPF